MRDLPQVHLVLLIHVSEKLQLALQCGKCLLDRMVAIVLFVRLTAHLVLQIVHVFSQLVHQLVTVVQSRH